MSDSTIGKNGNWDLPTAAKHLASDTRLGDSAPKFMNGIPKCWYGLLLEVDRLDRAVMGILNLVHGTSSGMHVHHEPSLSHSIFSCVIQGTD